MNIWRKQIEKKNKQIEELKEDINYYEKVLKEAEITISLMQDEIVDLRAEIKYGDLQ